jgi:hypothetical protein
MAMISPLFALVLASVLLLPATHAFVSPNSSAKRVTTSNFAHLPFEILDGTSTFLADEALSPAVEAARQKFWFYFFAGSGAGGIGIAQLPAIFRDAAASRAVAGTGPTRGGSALNAGPLLSVYYNTDISVNDIFDAIEKAPTAEFISSRSQSINFMASKGYIERRDFIKEMEAKNCNPLASYVLYDAISSGKGDVVSPVVYGEKLAAYRQESKAGGVAAGSFIRDLNGFLAVKVGAFLGLVFCLLVDFGFIAKAGIEGFLS